MTGQRLTLRQRQIALLIANGCSNKEIGEALGIATNTVSVHIRCILKVLNARSRGHIVGICLVTGEIDDAAVHVPEPPA